MFELILSSTLVWTYIYNVVLSALVMVLCKRFIEKQTLQKYVFMFILLTKKMPEHLTYLSLVFCGNKFNEFLEWLQIPLIYTTYLSSEDYMVNKIMQMLHFRCCQAI